MKHHTIWMKSGVFGIYTGDLQRVKAICLFLPGMTSNHLEKGDIFARTSQKLLENNIASLRFDYRGCGNSEGNHEDLTISSMCNDAFNVFKLLLKEQDIKEKHIFIIGRGNGAYVFLKLVEKFSKLITAAALWSPIVNLYNTIIADGNNNYIEMITQKGYVDIQGKKSGLAFFKEAEKIGPAYNFISKSKLPDLIIFYSKADKIVSKKDIDTFITKYISVNGKVVLNTVDNLGHNLDGISVMDKIVESTIIYFTNKMTFSSL